MRQQRDSGPLGQAQLRTHLQVQVLQVRLQLQVGVVGLQGNRNNLNLQLNQKQRLSTAGDTASGQEADEPTTGQDRGTRLLGV